MISTNSKEYGKLVKEYSNPSPKIKDFTNAFLVGGLICLFGQLLNEFFSYLNVGQTVIKTAVPSVIILIAGILTGIGVFDKIAKHAGAGTLVPITGFSNAVVSPAVEFKSEGYILGVGANIFKIAGPVIAYGVAASVVYGIIYYLITLF